MKLFQQSWSFSLLSYVILGVFRRGFSVAGITLGPHSSITFLLLIFAAGIGVVLGVLSWKRKEVSPWWVIGAIVLNVVMLLTGIDLLFPG